jgi:hypothetical protein
MSVRPLGVSVKAADAAGGALRLRTAVESERGARDLGLRAAANLQGLVMALRGRLTRDILGAARLVERAFGLGACPLTEAVRLVGELLKAA